MSTIVVEQVSEFPPVTRGAGARFSEEREQIAELLRGGENHRIPVGDDKEFNALSQKIRNVAKSIGVAVEIRNRLSAEGYLYFRQRVEDVALETVSE